jgi:quinol-cytochrome oxidoreductase complex cytochrome b subunit
MLTTFKNLKSELQQTGTVLGGLLIMLLLATIVSGLFLALFYNSQPEETYKSVVAIAGNPFTAFIRNFHFWSTDLLVFTLFVHLTRVALTKPTGKPRRYAWWLGVGLLIMVGVEMLLGTYLRGDQESIEAYSHFFLGTTGVMASYLPFITVITDFFSGHMALFRFFVFHAVIVPLGIFSVIVIHGLFAPSFRAMIMPWKKISDSTLRGQLTPQPGFFTTPSVRKLGFLTLGAFLLVTILSLFLDAPLLSAPHGGMEVTRTPWWLLWVVATENMFGLKAILFTPMIFFGVLFAIPFFTKDRPGPDLGVYIYLAAMIIVLALGFIANLSPQVPHTEEFMAGMEM